MADAFEKLGEEKVKALYPQDHTHFNAEGADLHAAMVVAGLKALALPQVTGQPVAEGCGRSTGALISCPS
jgi:hypothetical protein